MYNTNSKKILTKIPNGRAPYSFARGWLEALQKLPIPTCQVLEDDIRKILNINHQTFYRRLLGISMPTAEDYFNIKSVFNKYGIEQPFFSDQQDLEQKLANC